jgi:hypothetical protein
MLRRAPADAWRWAEAMPECDCQTFQDPIRSYDDVERRCANATAIQRWLDAVASDERWMQLLRCRACGQSWVAEYPFSEMHGGGPPCLYVVTPVLAEGWPTSITPIAARLRSRHDDQTFIEALGPEVGPNACLDHRCDRLAVRLSAYCSYHHFLQVRKRVPFSFEA